MTARTTRVAAELAKQAVLDAIDKLGAAHDDVVAIVGAAHAASQAIEEARERTRVAGAKLDILIKRIP